MAAKKPLDQELRRLVVDWQRQANDARRRGEDKSQSDLYRRLAQMEARRLGACINDTQDLLNGLEHPCDRRV